MLNYVLDAIMDTADPTFLASKNVEEESVEVAPGDGEEEESELQTLFKIIESLNEDFEKYLNDEIEDKEL